jgi:exodeoxyribonuclease VII large subunit
MEREFVDLLTLQQQMKEGVEDLFPDRVWVRAEIASVSVKSNGHCYMDLCQNGPRGAVAKAKAVIWRARYNLIAAAFKEATGSLFTQGMSVLVRVQVTYSELYGLTLSIDEVEPEFTLGEMELARRKTVARLQEEGMMDRQKELELAELPYALAVVSAADAAGYGDFRRHLLENEYGFAYRVDLFEATMQGVTAPASMIEALEEIETSEVRYDAVLILRGGGSAMDLACFDDYALALAIAQLPIPVFTAIGHDRDYHVADMVAFRFVKTPTALADEFLDCYAAEDARLENFGARLRLAFNAKISQMESRVELLLARIRAADPRGILERGYTLATDERGVVLKSAAGLAQGDRLRVLFRDGTLNCTVDGKV